MSNDLEVEVVEPAEVVVEQHTTTVEVSVEDVEREVVEVERLSAPAQVVLEQVIHEVDIAALGERGLPGTPGIPGPPGPTGAKGEPGSGGGFGGSYVHTQNTPAFTWYVHHNLGAYPAGIRAHDSAGTEWEGDVAYVDPDTVTITFSSAFSGVAYLS